MSVRKTAPQLAKMRAAGRVVAEMHDKIRAAIAPGVTTAKLDRIARDVIDRRGATSNFLGYHGYPAVICASLNEVVVHGIPTRRKLVDGDILSVDCGAIVDGWHADAAFTVGVGDIDEIRFAATAAGRRATTWACTPRASRTSCSRRSCSGRWWTAASSTRRRVSLR